MACDFFTVETVWLRRIYVLVFIELARDESDTRCEADACEWLCMCDLRSSVNAYLARRETPGRGHALAFAPIGTSVLHPCNLSDLTCEDAFRSFLSHRPGLGACR